MKKILLGTSAVLAIAVAAVIAVPFLIPAETLRQQAITQVKAATGRTLTIDGKLSASVFPALGLSLGQVGLSNPPGFANRDMIRFSAIEIRLKMLPLLTGKVEIDRFVLRDPVIALEVDRQGQNNWTLTPDPANAAGKENKATAAAKPAAGSAEKAPPAAPADISLGLVELSNGKLTYNDARSKTALQVDNIGVKITLPGLDQPLKLAGGARWNGKTVDLDLDLAKARALLDGSPTAFGVTLSGEPLKLALKGEMRGPSAVQGDLSLSVPSVRALLGWVGTPLPPGNGLGPLDISGKLALADNHYAVSQASLGLDALRGKGDLAIQTGGARPVIKGSLTTEKLDLTPYLTSQSQSPAQAPAPKAAVGGSGGTAPDWSDAPYDLSALKAAEADLSLSSAGVVVPHLTLGKSAVQIALHDGRLGLTLSELELYKGKGKGRLTVDGSGGLGLDAAFTLEGVQAEPLLQDAAGFGRLSGTAKTDITLSGRGSSERKLISSLSGHGSVLFSDGAITGINLAEMLRNVTTAFTAGNGTQKTDFASLGGSFTISSGLLTNKDLLLQSPLLRVEGAGTVDLPRRSQSYRLTPKLVASLEGQGGKRDLAGLSVPVLIEGTWENPTFRPDLAAAAQGALGNAVQNALGGKALPALPGVGGAGTAGSGSTAGGNSPGPLPLNPASLFGR